MSTKNRHNYMCPKCGYHKITVANAATPDERARCMACAHIAPEEEFIRG